MNSWRSCWAFLLLTLSLLVSDLASAEIHQTGGYLLREATVLGYSGCKDENQQSLTFAGVDMGMRCSEQVAKNECPTYYATANHYPMAVKTGSPATTSYGASATDDYAQWTRNNWVCNYITPSNGATYSHAFGPINGTCPLSAPVLEGTFPTYTCSCPGTVTNGKCFPPPPPENPCENAPQSVTAPPQVPAYSNGVGISGSAGCQLTNCVVPASYCIMDVDEPDLAGRGCDYAPTSWTRIVNGIIESQWSVVYTKTGSDCTADEQGPVPELPNDADSDGIPDDMDTDDDNDGIPDTEDTDVPPPPDSDSDGIPDATDTDDDGDGTPDVSDPDHPDYVPPAPPRDTDGDGTPDASDTDDDGDGIPDASDTDDDGDGIPDASDPDHPDYGGPTGTCDPAIETCGTCDPATQTCGGGATGGFYEPSDVTLQDVYNDYKQQVDQTELVGSIDNFFSWSSGGSCPVWSVSVPIFGTVVIDQQCSSVMENVWPFIAGVLLLVATWFAFRIAIE